MGMSSPNMPSSIQEAHGATLYRTFMPAFRHPIVSTSAFTLFNRLPQELQIIIWRLAEAERPQRIIDMDWRPEYSNTVPSLLHACRLSRAISLQYNQLIRHQRQKYLFINPNIDILSFKDHNLVLSYIKLWKNGRPTRQTEATPKPCPVMDFNAIADRIQDIYIKDRMSFGWFELGSFPVFANLKVLIINCPWTLHSEDAVHRWYGYWESVWQARQESMPRLMFSCSECWCCECAGRASLLHASCKPLDTVAAIEVK